MKRSIIKIARYVCLAIVIALGLVGCTADNDGNTKKGDSLSVYFYNPIEKKMIEEKVPFDPPANAPVETYVQAVKEALVKGPQNPNIQGSSWMSMPVNKLVESINLKDNCLNVHFKSTYTDLPVEHQMTLRASFVLSFTELPFIDEVEFFIDNAPLTASSGEKIGAMKSNQIVRGALDPKPPTNTQTIKLYFAKPGSDKLYVEERQINVNNNVLLERYIVEELIKGPTDKDLVSLIPPDTKINDIKTKDGISQLDLSSDFKSKQPLDDRTEELLAYSIVNSLTEIPRVQKVTFLIDGMKQGDVASHVDFSELFERDESLIADPK